MQILKHKTNIDFIGKRKPAIFISTLINLAILVGIARVGLQPAAWTSPAARWWR